MSNFVNKVGHFLSPSLHKHSLPGETHGLQHYTFTNPEKGQPSNGGCGADTSSVTSFLMAMLSSSNAKYPRWCRSPGAPEEVVYSSDLSANLGSCEPDDDNEEQGPDKCGKFPCESIQESKHEDENNGAIYEYAPQSALQPASMKLPPLSDESSLLSEDIRAFVALALPTIAKDRHWILLYSTAKHGTSMRTLYKKCSTLSEPFLLVIGDLEGAIFGGLATAPLKPTAQRKYSGTSDSFVFTNVHKDPRLFKATVKPVMSKGFPPLRESFPLLFFLPLATMTKSGTLGSKSRKQQFYLLLHGANRYYLLCTNEAISFGGGGHFALHLDDTLLTGSSGACDTFGNDCLATSLDFKVSNIEVWGFSHALRHA